MKTKLALILMLFPLFQAIADLSYYPKESIELIEDHSANKELLKEDLFNVLSLYHVKKNNQNDTLSENCPQNEKCIKHRNDIDYNEARKILFGNLFLQSLGQNKYLIKEVYCNKTIDQTEGVGPEKIPNFKLVNCEHTWPQSKFSTNFSKDIQRSDLHHLFPSDMRANSTRNNHPFAEVNGKNTNEDCEASQIGMAQSNSSLKSFEPPSEHKGNVARAIYYFATRYKMPIPKTQDEYLKKWNLEDPVDEQERIRNDKIMHIQGNRNPFIDFPELVNRL